VNGLIPNQRGNDNLHLAAAGVALQDRLERLNQRPRDGRTSSDLDTPAVLEPRHYGIPAPVREGVLPADETFPH
jgi:hypothetical protein